MRRYDLAVVGGGTARLIAALVGAGAGARVCLVERARWQRPAAQRLTRTPPAGLRLADRRG